MLDQIMPTWLRWVLITALALWLANQLYQHGRDVEAKACALDQSRAAVQLSTERRQDEQQTTEIRTEVSDDHIQAIKTIEAERDAAAAAAERLRVRLRQAIDSAKRAGASDPASEQGGKAVDAIGAALAACTAEYRAMGADAAERYATGRRCEGEYDALIGERRAPDAGSGQ